MKSVGYDNPSNATEQAEKSSLQPTNASVESLQQDTPLARTRSVSSTLARVASRLSTRSTPNPSPPPDGGLQAWTQAFCAWIAIICSWGFVNSFGAFQSYYADTLPQTNSTISWIGSTQACLMFVMSAFSGRAFDAGFFRLTVISGLALYFVGIFTMSVANNYWQLLLTHGVCTGAGGGIFFIPIMSLASTYFEKRRGLALGFVTTGNSVGGIVYPLVVRQLLGKVGFGWTVRVLGFINVVILCTALALMRPRLPPRKSGPLIDPASLRDGPYLLLVLGICFLMPPVYFVYYYVASYGRDVLHMPYTQSINLVILVNGIGFPFRILPGFLADRYLGALNTFTVCILCSALVRCSWLAVSSVTDYYVFITFEGIFCAAFQSMYSTVVVALSDDITKTGTRLGMAFSAVGFSALAGGPMSGAMLRASGGYTAPICWASASTLCGGALCFWARGKKFGWGLGVKC